MPVNTRPLTPLEMRREQEREAERARQFASWGGDVQALLAKLGKDYGTLSEKLQTEIAGQARDIADMRDALHTIDAAGRFGKHAAAWRRGGPYRGPCGDPHTAQKIGRLAAAMHAAKETGDTAELRQLCHASINDGTGAAGGYTLPDYVSETILRNVEQYGVLERDTPPMGVPVKSGSITKRTGGLTVYHPDLDSAATTSAPSFGRVPFELTRWAIACYVERWMLDAAMAGALGDFVVEEIAQALAYTADLYGFMGDGTSTYARTVGVFKQAETDQLVVTADTGDNTFAEVTAKHVEYLGELMGAVPQWVHVAGPRYYMHLSVWASYLGQRLTGGEPVANILGSDSPSPFRLMGYPVSIVQVAPSMTAGTQASTVLAVFGALQRGVKIFRLMEGLRLMVSEHVRLLQGQVTFYAELNQQVKIADNQCFAQLKAAAS